MSLEPYQYSSHAASYYCRAFSFRSIVGISVHSQFILIRLIAVCLFLLLLLLCFILLERAASFQIQFQLFSLPFKVLTASSRSATRNPRVRLPWCRRILYNISSLSHPSFPFQTQPSNCCQCLSTTHSQFSTAPADFQDRHSGVSVADVVSPTCKSLL